MTRPDKTLLQVVHRASEASIAFDDLCALLRRLGFEERIRGSHHTFRKSGISEMINLQRAGAQAKPYQVRQVRRILLKYGLGDQD